MPEAVTAEVPIGLVVLQARFTGQLLLPDAMAQEVGLTERLPDICAKLAETVQALVMAPVV